MNAIAFSTAVGPSIRFTDRASLRFFSWSSTFFEITDSGPSTNTLGRSCSRRAFTIGAGMPFLLTGSTASPERAAQAAAGMANSPRSAE